MLTVLYTGLNSLHSVISSKLSDEDFELKEVVDEPFDLTTADLFVIGSDEKNPVKLVQKINSIDQHISIIIICNPKDFPGIKQAIQFAPFVGKNTLCIAFTENFDVKTSFNNAGTRTRQKRSFSKINKKTSSLTSVISSSIKFENIGIFLEKAPIGVLLVDEENNVAGINKKAKDFFKSEDRTNYVLKDFFPAFSIQQLKLASGNSEVISKTIEVNNHVLELHLSEAKNEDGKRLNILMFNDITEQKRKEAELKESEALFRFMAEAMPQKIWTADAEGYRNFFNKRWIDYTGLSLNKLEGWRWTTIIHPDDLEANLLQWRSSIETGRDFEFEHRLLRKDGEYRWHLVRGVARKDVNGKVLLWIGTNTDIHEQKAFTEQLEQKVKERTIELEQSNNELQQFVYVTSHDLQEPLRKIRIFSDMLKDSISHLDEKTIRQADKINATALRMTTLLQELLNFTHLNKQEQMEETDLNEIVRKALIDLELTINEKSAVIHAEPLPVITAIPVQMHQLFYNLINNSLKFSKPGTAPVINIHSKKADPGSIKQFSYLDHNKSYHEIIVQDNGIGFDQNYAEQIFNVFQRLHNRTEYSGTGIGLALCKKVVTNHSGAIYAVSEKDKGTTFYILLPIE